MCSILFASSSACNKAALCSSFCTATAWTCCCFLISCPDEERFDLNTHAFNHQLDLTSVTCHLNLTLSKTPGETRGSHHLLLIGPAFQSQNPSKSTKHIGSNQNGAPNINQAGQQKLFHAVFLWAPPQASPPPRPTAVVAETPRQPDAHGVAAFHWDPPGHRSPQRSWPEGAGLATPKTCDFCFMDVGSLWTFIEGWCPIQVLQGRQKMGRANLLFEGQRCKGWVHVLPREVVLRELLQHQCSMLTSMSFRALHVAATALDTLPQGFVTRCAQLPPALVAEAARRKTTPSARRCHHQSLPKLLCLNLGSDDSPGLGLYDSLPSASYFHG